MIRLKNISKSFDGDQSFAVRDVSFEIGDGETVVLLGTSGSGKTTTLKMINRLVEPTGGDIEVDGVNARQTDLLTLRRSIGYVFQNIGLFPHMTVWGNAAIVLRLQGVEKHKRRKKAEELLALVGLEPKQYATRYPRQLSGGQQQRVGIARALAADPKYLLMDEPFGALDAVTRDQLQGELIQIRERVQKTIVFVTHDLFEAMRLGDRIGVMNKGRLEQIGTKEELLDHPATPFVSQLFEHAQRQADMLAEAQVQS